MAGPEASDIDAVNTDKRFGRSEWRGTPNP